MTTEPTEQKENNAVGGVGLNFAAFIAKSGELATAFEIIPELTEYITGGHTTTKPSLRVTLFDSEGKEFNYTIINARKGEEAKRGLEDLGLKDISKRNQMPKVIVQKEEEDLVPGSYIANPLLISLIQELSKRLGVEELVDRYPRHIDLITVYGRD